MSWIILRTAPRSTLGLAQSLSDAGHEAWTPRETLLINRTRTKAGDERDAPIMPSFVFVRAEHLTALHMARMFWPSRHPRFSFFRNAGMTPELHDAAIEPLRQMERDAAERHEMRRRRVRKPPTFSAGQTVKVDQTAFTGLEGVVKDQAGADVLVCFGGKVTMKINAWRLLPNSVGSERDAA